MEFRLKINPHKKKFSPHSFEDLAMSLPSMCICIDDTSSSPLIINDPGSFLSSPITFNMRVISKVTSILWKSASDEEKKVYKKLADQVYEIHYQRTSSIYKKITASAVKGRSNIYKPYLSFPIQLSSSSISSNSTAPPLSLSSVPATSAPFVYPPTSFNFSTFNFTDNHDNNSDIDLNTYTDFNSINNVNNNQVISYPNPNYQSTEQNNQQVVYLFKKFLFNTSQNF